MFPVPPSSSGKLPQSSKTTARILQIIVAALMMGVTVYGLFVLGKGALKEAPKPPQMAMMAAGMAAVNFVLHIVIPGFVDRQAERVAKEGVPTLLGLYQNKTVIAGALLEGAAFFNLFALSAEHHWWSLAIVVLLLIALAILIPTSIRIDHWVESKQLEAR